VVLQTRLPVNIKKTHKRSEDGLVRPDFKGS
jgi:hypothetical protein